MEVFKISRGMAKRFCSSFSSALFVVETQVTGLCFPRGTRSKVNVAVNRCGSDKSKSRTGRQRFADRVMAMEAALAQQKAPVSIILSLLSFANGYLHRGDS